MEEKKGFSVVMSLCTDSNISFSKENVFVEICFDSYEVSMRMLLEKIEEMEETLQGDLNALNILRNQLSIVKKRIVEQINDFLEDEEFFTDFVEENCSGNFVVYPCIVKYSQKGFSVEYI